MLQQLRSLYGSLSDFHRYFGGLFVLGVLQRERERERAYKNLVPEFGFGREILSQRFRTGFGSDLVPLVERISFLSLFLSFHDEPDF